MNGPAIHVRPAVLADGPAIGEAHAAAWMAAYADLFEEPFLSGAADSRRVLWPWAIPELLVAPSFVLVAEVDESVLAFAHGKPADSGEPAGEVHGFYSHPAAWGTGAAAALLDQACAILATDWSEVVLWTLDGAARAHRFYEKMGFRRSGRSRRETLTNWITGDAVERTALEYRKPLEGRRP